MSIDNVIILFLLFSLKHFIVDFVLQTEQQVQTKGILFHPVGFSHSLEHGIWAAAICNFYLPMEAALGLGYLDIALHYPIDFIKMRFGCRDISKPLFWNQLGLDQFLHYCSYVFLIWCTKVLYLGV